MRYDRGFTRQVQRRIFQLKETVKLDTLEMRNKLITELNDLFDIATSIAKGKISQQQVGDKMQAITPKERQMYAQVAANIGMVMGNLSKAYDERQIDKDLDKLEEMLKKEYKKEEAAKHADKTDVNSGA